jgi:transcriptional regulator with XRE-family HTH domain
LMFCMIFHKLPTAHDSWNAPMPKTPAAPVEKPAPNNPMQLMLGTFLRLERRRLGETTARVAEELGLSETYFRLVESGRAPLNQSAVFKLLDFLATKGAAAQTPARIHFQRMALYLVGAHWVGAEMAVLKDAAKPDLVAMQRLAEKDDNFQVFHMRTQGYYDLKDDGLKKAFLTGTAVSEVSAFLGNLDYNSPSADVANLLEKALPKKIVLAMPTMNLEIVKSLVEGLSGRPFIHSARLAAKWENDNAQYFKKVRGVYAQTDLVISARNFSLFHFPYLFNQNCDEVRFLFVATETNVKIKKKFIDMLNHARQMAGLKLFGQDEINKLQIACLSANDFDDFETQLSKLQSGANVGQRYGAYWSFDTTAAVPISFIGAEATGLAAGVHDIWNLSLEESFTTRIEFDKLWSKFYGHAK